MIELIGMKKAEIQKFKYHIIRIKTGLEILFEKGKLKLARGFFPGHISKLVGEWLRAARENADISILICARDVVENLIPVRPSEVFPQRFIVIAL